MVDVEEASIQVEFKQAVPPNVKGKLSHSTTQVQQDSSKKLSLYIAMH